MSAKTFDSIGCSIVSGCSAPGRYARSGSLGCPWRGPKWLSWALRKRRAHSHQEGRVSHSLLAFPAAKQMWQDDASAYQRISVRFVGLTLSRVCKGKLCILGVIAIEVEVAVVTVVAVEVTVEVEVMVCQHTNLIKCTGDFQEHTHTPTRNSESMSNQS